MWYKITAVYESGKTRSYEKKGMVEVMKMVARLNAANDVIYCKDNLVDVKIEKEA